MPISYIRLLPLLEEFELAQVAACGPADGSTHWSSYRLAKEVGVSQSTVGQDVAAIWAPTAPVEQLYGQ